ncbi:Pentatricopeptide repeat-containing protein [Glycine soja]
MTDRDVVSWSSMIAAYVACNSPLDAFHMFREMGMENEEPNSVTLVSLLSACTKMLNLSAVDEGKMYFDWMVRVYGIKPSVEHYGCMVYLLGRAGLIKEAYDIIKGMPMEPNDVILRSFLSACRNQGCASSLDDDFLSKLESVLGANYVLTGNVFSTYASWNWKDANDLRVAMKQKGLKKIPGCSWVRSEVQS